MNITEERAEEMLNFLLTHARYCQTGTRMCADCRLARDPQRITYVALAKAEIQRVSSWIHANRDTCIYCGTIAEHLDHLVPKPWTGYATRRLVPTVPSCGDCNVRIRDRLTTSIHERASIVAEGLRKKHKKLLLTPERTPAELDEFEGRLLVSVRAAQARRAEVIRRLAVLDCGGAPEAPDLTWKAAA